MAAQNDLPDISIDSKGLYREDVFTDRRAGSIRRLTPVTVDGSTDPSRPVLFSGQTQLLTPAGVLPLGFEIEAKSLDEALQKFPEGVKVALEQAIDEAREMRREAAEATAKRLAALPMLAGFDVLDWRGLVLAAASSAGATLQFFSGRSISRYLSPAVFGSLVHIAIWPITLLIALCFMIRRHYKRVVKALKHLDVMS
jgi:hypothetical protein